MKFVMLIVVAFIVIVLLFLGNALIGNEYNNLPNETQTTQQANSTQNIVSLMFVGMSGVPAAFIVIALIAIFAVLAALKW